MWKFKDHRIAKLNKGTDESSTHDTSDERFKDRLKLGQTTVSLIISNSRITDSGDYHLIMISSSHTVQRTINVTVSGLSPGAVAGIVVGVGVLVFAVAFMIYNRCKISERQRRKDVAENNGTNDYLKDETVNSDDL
ncbi:uncharacterized protein LOC143735494 [Siphateles boraxobius]|uniref:uncharacterized protein LOC143735494 n=1 Tax=Siphateles boraxobius TaxID=180520 RepID=UPI004063C68C